MAEISYNAELQKMFALQKFGMKFGLSGLAGILEKLGNPHHGPAFVHLAGTNGKGSVGIMLQTALSRAGYRAGLYTSPHLITFRERIRIGEELVSHQEVLNLSRQVWAACEADNPPTFFEFVTAMAFLYFQAQKVEVAIIEAGLGGRLDSTNVITPVVAAITNISLEHTEYLGNTVAAIAGEKAGIIKAGVPVVLGRLLSEAGAVIREVAVSQQSSVLELGVDFQAEITASDALGRPTFDFKAGSGASSGFGEKQNWPKVQVNLAGLHQADNAAVALVLAHVLRQKGFAKLSDSHMREGLAQAAWPGRLEPFLAGTWPPLFASASAQGRAPLLLDGAHNPAGTLALARTLATLSYKKLHLIVGVMADKDISGVLEPIYRLAHRIYLTRPEFNRAATPGQLWDNLANTFGSPQVLTTLHLSIPEALGAAAQEAAEGDLVVLSGSLFTVGEGRAYLTGVQEVEPN